MKIKCKPIPKFEDHERFFSKIRVNGESGCWEWQAHTNDSGYGVFHIIDRDYSAHRISWSIFKEGPPTDMVIDHICRNRKCVNVEHLRVVDVNTNILENSIGGAAINKAKTHCNRGHELVGGNLIRSKMPSGNLSRNCRECFNQKRRERRASGKKH